MSSHKPKGKKKKRKKPRAMTPLQRRIDLQQAGLMLNRVDLQQPSEFEATPFADLPVTEDPWNPQGDSDSEIIAEILGPDGNNWNRMKQANLSFAPGSGRGDPPEIQDAYKLKVARMRDGVLTVYFRQLASRVAIINGAREGVDVTEAVKRDAFGTAMQYYNKLDIPQDERPVLTLKRNNMKAIVKDLDGNGASAQGGNKFAKDILRVGKFVVDGLDEVREFSAGMLNSMADSFQKFIENGVRVPIVKNHDADIEAVVGYATGLQVIGDRLVAAMEMTSDDGVRLANTCKDVSCRIEFDFVDGMGFKHDVALTHIGIVQNPAIPGQLPFVQLSYDSNQTKTEDKEMTLEQLAGFLGWKPEKEGDEFTEEKAENMIAELSRQNGELSQQLETAIEAAKAGGDDSAGGSEIHPDLLDQLAEATEIKLTRLVETGRITPATQKMLSLGLVGEEGKRRVQTLSRGANANGSEALAKTVIAALEELPEKHHGSLTGAQILNLKQGGDDADAMAEEEKTAYRKKRSTNLSRYMNHRTTVDA